jgi:thiamine-phosphate pyrophosphorylase
MHARHPSNLPRLWLMTDERMGDGVLATVATLPKGAGVVFRHYSQARNERQALFDEVLRIAKRRRLMLVTAGEPLKGARLRHHAFTMPVHSLPERIAAERTGSALLFVSPVYPTRSHPGARALGRVKLGLLIRGAKLPIIALGGMTHRRAAALGAFNIHGWAGIDGLTVRT